MLLFDCESHTWDNEIIQLVCQYLFALQSVVLDVSHTKSLDFFFFSMIVEIFY